MPRTVNSVTRPPVGSVSCGCSRVAENGGISPIILMGLALWRSLTGMAAFVWCWCTCWCCGGTAVAVGWFDSCDCEWCMAVDRGGKWRERLLFGCTALCSRNKPNRTSARQAKGVWKTFAFSGGKKTQIKK